MHTEPYNFVKELSQKLPQYFNNKKVLEVGSLDINGSVRQFFRQCDYTGIDLGEGKGVDRVIGIQDLHEPLSYDTVISTEMLEHDRYWERSLKSMYDNLKVGGLLILSCAGPDRQEHGTSRQHPGDAPFTNDWYRNISQEDFGSVLPMELFTDMHLKYMRGMADLLFYGIKK